MTNSLDSDGFLKKQSCVSCIVCFLVRGGVVNRNLREFSIQERWRVETYFLGGAQEDCMFRKCCSM